MIKNLNPLQSLSTEIMTETLKTIRASVIAILVIFALGTGYYFLLKRANVRIESGCATRGGQVLVQPASVSKCLYSPTK